MTSPPPSGAPQPGAAALGLRDVLLDAVRYWEPRRIWYNLTLLALVAIWFAGTWPHFRPALSVASLLRLLGLAALANLCYCAAYLVAIPLQESGWRPSWRRHRWALWLAGTVVAILFANYWIADEIYPFVN